MDGDGIVSVYAKVLGGVLWVCSVVLSMALGGAAAVADAIYLDPEVTYQTVTGWEATPNLADDPTRPEWGDALDGLIARAVNEIGLTRLRVEVRAGVETRDGRAGAFFAGEIPYEDWKTTYYDAVNDNDDPFVIDPDGFDFTELDWTVRTYVQPMAAAMAARGERLAINLCYVAFRSGMTLHRQPEEYAELVLAVHRHLDRTYGLRPDTWEVILEPDLPEDGWTGTDIGRAIVASAARLADAGYDTRFVAPSVTDLSNAAGYLQDILAVPGAGDHLAEVSYHRYRGVSRRALEGLRRRAGEAGKPTAMLEWWFGKGTHEVLIEDLDTAGAAAWQGAALVSHFRNVSDLGADAPLRREVAINSLVFRNVRPGAQRIGATTGLLSALTPVAFAGPNGRFTVLATSRRLTEVTVHGLPAGRYRLEMALEDGGAEPSRVLRPDASGTIVFDMEGRGLLALVGPLESDQ